MTSEINIYYNCKITPSKLFIVDSISDYLSTLTKVQIQKFQYVRQNINISIKIDKSQTNLDFSLSNNMNYCSIQNGSEKICYYFISNKRQVSQDTIELYLEMDTINTFKPTTDFTIQNKTLINRQHKNRFIKKELEYSGEFTGISYDQDYSSLLNITTWTIKSTPYEELVGAEVVSFEISLFPESGSHTLSVVGGTFQIGSDGHIEFFITESGNIALVTIRAQITLVYKVERTYRKIDLQSEGLTPVLYGKDEYKVSGDNQSWYLIYKGNPIKCFVCADEQFDVTMASGNTISATDLTAGTYYYILAYENNKEDVSIKTDTGLSFEAYFDYVSSPFTTERSIIQYWRDGANIKLKKYYYTETMFFGYVFTNATKTYTFSSFEFTSNQSSVIVKTLPNETHDISTIRNGGTESVSLITTTSTNHMFSEVDITSADLVKIIKLPYRPYNNLSAFKYDPQEHMIYLDNLSIPLDYKQELSDYNPLDELTISLPTRTLDTLKSHQYESKLFHSDYYQPKFIYDSYAYVFELERVNLEYYNHIPFSFVFSVTNTINSRFLFTFDTYITDGYCQEDYPAILYVARNNEVTILSSDYLNYLKMGYNYDVKTKERQEAGLWIGAGLSLVGSIASFASSGVTHGFGIAGGISLATTAMAQIVSAVNTTAQAEATQNQKLFQYKNQRASVFGADDVDLMCRYTDNKAKFMLYKVSERMENILFDLFYYTGYISGERGTPSIHTRVWFNFLACELEIDENSSKNIPEAIINDIKMKYSAGVTFLHKNTLSGVATWDFAQQYENWEVTI